MLSGTAIAQVIPMAMAPILTRLYHADDYGRYALFMLVAYTISALASLRYEFAIMLPEEEEDAASIVVVCLMIAGCVTIVLASIAIACTLVHTSIPQLDGMGIFVHLLGPMVLFQSAYQTFNYWILRKQAFRELAASRIFRSIAMAVANLAFGLLHWGGGLILSSVLGQLVATLFLGIRMVRHDRAPLLGVTRARMRAQSRMHRRFALYALPADLLSTLSQQLPIALFSPNAAGFFSFVQNVINAPLNFVSGAILDAFKERATRDYRERKEFRAIYVRIFRSLAVMSVPPAAILLVAGPSLFALIFGEPWREAGSYARILAITIMLKFVVSPLSYAYYVVGRQQEDFLIHIGIAAGVSGALLIGLFALQSTKAALILFSTSYGIAYLVYLIRSYQFARGHVRS